MAVEEILYTDNLRKGTDKINASIKQANKSEDDASSALNTANTAKSTADATATQLETVIIESGTSDAEILAARTDGNTAETFPTVGGRLDNVKQHLLDTESRQNSLLPNAVDTLNLQNYLGNDQNIHPKVLYFESGWNGFNYWMAYTPYPFGATADENPCIGVSNNMVDWTIPVGLINPLEPMPTSGYNNDTHLVYRSDLNQMEIWWRHYDPGTSTFSLYRRTSLNGINWTAKELLISGTTGDMLSPAIIYEDGVYKVWSCSGTVVDYRTMSTSLVWSTKNTLPIDWGTLSAWHLDVTKTDKGYEMVVCAYKPGGNNNTADLYHVIALNGGAFTKPKLILPKNPNPSAFDHQAIYRSSMIKKDDMYYIFYSAIENEVSKRRSMSLCYGTDIEALNGYAIQRKKQLSIGTQILDNFSVSGVDSIRISGTPTTFRNLTGGKLGQVIDVVLFGSSASAVFENTSNLTTPNQLPYTLTNDSQGVRLICTNEFTSHFRLIATPTDNKTAFTTRISRDVSLTTVQTVALPFKAKSITFTGMLFNTKMITDGAWSEQGQMQVRFINGTTLNYQYDSAYVVYLNDGNSIARASISNITATGFDLTWTKSGTAVLTGTAQIIVTAHN